MNDFGYYGGGHIAQFIGMAVWGLVMLVLLVVGLGLAFLLARFLLVATKAAQHYLDKNGVVSSKPAKPAPTGLYSPGRPAEEPASSVVPPTPTPAPSTTASSSTASSSTPTEVLPPKAAAPKAATPTTGAPKPATSRKTPTATTPITPVEPPTTASTKPVSKPRTPKTPPPAV